MAFINPSDSSEVLYGSSGDVRNELNAYLSVNTAGHYSDENEAPGNLIVNSLRKATRIINGFLEPVYADQIPFSAAASVPKLLDEISSDIATFYVLRSLSAKVGPVSEEKRRDYYEDYIGEDGLLTRIAEREVQLPELTADYPDDAKSIRSQDRTPVFDMDDPVNWEVDPDLKDDIADDRAE